MCSLIRMYAPWEQGLCFVHCCSVATCSRYSVNNCERTESDVPQSSVNSSWGLSSNSYGLDSIHLLMSLFSDFFQGHQPCAAAKEQVFPHQQGRGGKLSFCLKQTQSLYHEPGLLLSATVTQMAPQNLPALCLIPSGLYFVTFKVTIS